MNDYEQLLLCFLDQRAWDKALLVLESVDVATVRPFTFPPLGTKKKDTKLKWMSAATPR